MKVRVTIAASGQGRWGEELDFPVDCVNSGYLPVLLVLDPTPNPKLDELRKVFLGNKGLVFIGDEAWQHLDAEAGPTMARFLETYVRKPISDLLRTVPEELPEMTLGWLVLVLRCESAVKSLPLSGRQKPQLMRKLRFPRMSRSKCRAYDINQETRQVQAQERCVEQCKRLRQKTRVPKRCSVRACTIWLAVSHFTRVQRTISGATLTSCFVPLGYVCSLTAAFGMVALCTSCCRKRIRPGGERRFEDNRARDERQQRQLGRERLGSCQALGTRSSHRFEAMRSRRPKIGCTENRWGPRRSS